MKQLAKFERHTSAENKAATVGAGVGVIGGSVLVQIHDYPYFQIGDQIEEVDDQISAHQVVAADAENSEPAIEQAVQTLTSSRITAYEQQKQELVVNRPDSHSGVEAGGIVLAAGLVGAASLALIVHGIRSAKHNFMRIQPISHIEG
jgi:capsule polysaccharide export protein KpsE/RkpR